jgi:hypothetical protein
MSFEVQDCNGRKLKVGDKVLYGDPNPNDVLSHTATITKITEPDGDYDDNLERAVEICPYVHIIFDADTYEAADKEICYTYNNTPVSWNDYPDGPSHYIYEAEDLEWVDGTEDHN